jgi:hypothetical protein
MLSFKRLALLVLATVAVAAGQPALTTIQDILYRADGSRYSGTLFIRWSSFEAGDTSNIATADLALPIVNGVLNVRLVPTTTASAGARYDITYNSQGKNEFTEVWAVSPSAVTLRVRDVRVASGTVVGPPPVTSPVQISDVVGLVDSLALLASKGVGFAPGRAAVINTSGQIDGASGSLADCVRVDGSSGPCGGGASGVLPLFSDGETPAGSVDGSNTFFSLNFAPSPAASLAVYRNGLLQKPGVDFSISGSSITFFLGSTPQTGDLIEASYRYGDPNNPLGSLTAAQVICSGAGSGTTASTLTQLGSCTIPARLLGTGDRVELQFQYSHSGTTTGFTGEIHWGNTTVLSTGAPAGETALAGRISFGIEGAGQTWGAQDWGNLVTLAATAGSASADTTVNLTISFNGKMAGATTENVSLQNFTVVRYPAQSNP